MTRLLQQAIGRVKALPPAEQNRIAAFLLNELKEDGRWASSTAAHNGKLKAFIDQVNADDRAGKCERLEPEHL